MSLKSKDRMLQTWCARGTRAEPLRQWQAVVGVLAPGIALDPTAHPSQSLGEMLSLLLDQSYKREDDESLPVVLQFSVTCTHTSDAAPHCFG